jgi:hypothetical protein
MKKTILKICFCFLLFLTLNQSKAQEIIVGYSDLFSINTQLTQITPITGYSSLFAINTILSQVSPITGYSDLFTINTLLAQITPIVAYSDLFYLNTTFGDLIVGYSGLFPINTVTATIYGTIANSMNGQPLEGAVVKTLQYESMPSAADGSYNLYVPYGYGYELTILAENFETAYVGGIHVPQNSPDNEVNISLVPVPIIHSLVTIDPNPNPVISSVQQGGTLHRYYRVVNNNTGSGLPQVPVHVTGANFSKTFSSNEKGIVDIAINSNQVGNGQIGQPATFTIESMAGIPLPEPVSFNCSVIKQEYGKYWDSYTFGKIGLSFVEVSGKKGSSLMLFGNDPANAHAESFLLRRQAEGTVGAEFSVGVELGVQCDNVVAGGEATAGIGGNVSVKTEDFYHFNRGNSSTDYEALGRYILATDGMFDFLDQTLYALLLLGEIHFQNQYNLLLAYEGDRKAIEVGVYGMASSGIGIGAVNVLGVGVSGQLGAEAKVGLDFVNNQIDAERETAIEFSGKFATTGQAGLNFGMSLEDPVNGELSANVTIHNKEFERGIRFAVVRDVTQGNLPIKEVKFTLLKRNVKNKSGWQEEMTYFMSGTDLINAIENISSINLIYQLVNLPGGSVMEVASNVFIEIVEAIFNTAYYLQADDQGQASINFVKERVDIENSGSFEVKIKAGLLFSGLSAEIGGGVGFEQGSFYTKEKGKWVWGKHFVLEENNGIGPFSDSYEKYMQDIVDDLPNWFKQLLGFVDWITFWNKDATLFYVGDAGSYLEIDPAAIPPTLDSISCTSWSWYGSAPSKKLNDLSDNNKQIVTDFKKKAEKSFEMEYGIGGFYQFEPYDTQLLDTCWLTIVYDQSDVGDHDESSLAMYWEDKKNRQWVHIGGIVDSVNNTVTAPITHLALFTLAPELPYGTFGMNAVPDSIYSDSISVSVITSDTIFYNNLLPVTDGELFTVTTTYGEIITPDADTTLAGIQIEAVDNKITFELKSATVSGEAIVTAQSTRGSANGRVEVIFFDTIPPTPPVIDNILAGDKTVDLTWFPNAEPDIAGYVLYYDTDTIMPLNGIHTVYGEPSPINLGVITTRKVTGLFNDSTYYFAVSAIDVSGNESPLSAFVSATPGGKFIALNVFLEGPFNGIDEMNTDLNNAYLISLTQPFNTAPWYYSGNESVLAIPNSDVVDWVLVEFRETAGDSSTATPGTKIGRQAGFILRNGSIVSRNGSSPLEFNYAVNYNLYVVIYHRNHLPVMSAVPVVKTDNLYLYDFTTGAGQAYGCSDAQKEIKPDLWGMIAGDVNADGIINLTDKSPEWEIMAGEAGYQSADVNLDGEVNNIDKDDFILPNLGKEGMLPE